MSRRVMLSPVLLLVTTSVAFASGGVQEPGSTRLALSPDEAFPLQEVTILGLPDDVAGIGVEAVPLDDRGSESGETILLYAVRLESGEPVFVAPQHPAGLDAGGRFRIVSEDGSLGGPLILTVKPLPAASGQTAGLLGELGQVVEAVVEMAGGDPDRLRTGAIEDASLHLLGAAVGLRVIERTRSELSPLDLAWTDRWLATRSIAAATTELSDRVAKLPQPPDGVDFKESNTPRGVGTSSRPALRAHFASVVPWPPATPATRSMSRAPWDKVEICSQCPGALDYWMNLQTELELGYGSLAERMARDRNLFDFLDSLDGPPPDGMTRKTGGALSTARDQAKKRAGNPLASLKTPEAKRGLALLAAIEGVFELTIDLNDKFLVALLPSILLPSGVAVMPQRFNEDDRRAEPAEGSGTWRTRVTARSEQAELSATELLGYFKRLKSMIGKTESGVFGSADDDTKVGVCVPGGSAPKEADAGLGEAACTLAGDVIDETSKTLKRYERARKALGKAQDLVGADDSEPIPEPNFDVISYGPFQWPGIDVSDPKWSAARSLGACVRVVAGAAAGAAVSWRTMIYSPVDPAESWGNLADHDKAPEFGFKPVAVGDCDLRLSTRVDRFGDAPPVHLDVPVSVEEIRMDVTPRPVKLAPGETEVFEAMVWNADSLDVGWHPSLGAGSEIHCESEASGRPCFRWTAPELAPGECRRPVRITATSLARRGLRVSGEPVRESRVDFEVLDPSAELRIVKDGTPIETLALERNERVRLRVAGPAAIGSDIEWSATGGSFDDPEGLHTMYRAPEEAGTFRITASSRGSKGCAPSLLVTVLADDGFAFTVGGGATGEQTGWIWVARRTPPTADVGGGMCHAVIHFVPESRGTGLAGLTALPLFGLDIAATDGIQAGKYVVAADETMGMGNAFQRRESRPNQFFASLGARLANPDEHQAQFSGFSFFSRGGTVWIDAVDERRIVGRFAVVVRTLAPRQASGERFEFVEATVSGSFAGPFKPDESRMLLTRHRPKTDRFYDCRPGDS